jgi:hypothetical protein
MRFVRSDLVRAAKRRAVQRRYEATGSESWLLEHAEIRHEGCDALAPAIKVGPRDRATPNVYYLGEGKCVNELVLDTGVPTGPDSSQREEGIGVTAQS